MNRGPLASRGRTLAAAFAWSVLALYWAYARAPTDGIDTRYFVKSPDWLATELDGLLVLTAASTAAMFLALDAVRRSGNPRVRQLAASAIGLSLLLPLGALVRDAARVLSVSLARWPLVLGPALAVGLAALLLAVHRRPDRTLAALLGLLVVTAPFGAVTVAGALHARYEYAITPDPDPRQPAPTDEMVHATETDPEGRVVVLVFDMLDRRLAFDDRPSGIELPTLDRLADEAVRAPQAYAPAQRTLASIPAMLTGEAVRHADPEGANDLSLRTADGSETTLSQTPTVFDHARAAGAEIGLAGFYHPYCRLTDVDRCTWEPGREAGHADASTPQMMADAALKGLEALPTATAEELRIELGTHQASRHQALYETLHAEAVSMAADPDLDLVYVHYNIPHRPAIYDAETGELGPTTDASYRDNLALVDQALAELRDAMQANDLWTESTLVVTSDHGDRRDPSTAGLPDRQAPSPYPAREVPLLVDPPGKTAGEDVDRPLEVRVLPALVEGLLDGELTTDREIAAFLADEAPEPVDAPKR